MMVRLAFTIFTILLLSVFLSITLNTSIGHNIPLSYIILAFLMFIMSMFTKISNFKYLVVIMSLVITTCLVFMHKNKKIEIKKIKELCLKPSLFVFFFFFIYLYIVTSNVQLSNIDDLGYWGTRVLDINRTDALYTKEYTVFSNFSYPPFTALIQIVFVKLFGKFEQSYLILAQASFSFSLFLILFDKFKNRLKEMAGILLTLVLIISVTLMVQKNQSFGDNAFIYNSIYVDWLMGLMLGKCMSLYYNFNKNEISSYIEIGLYESALILVKPTAIPLVILIAFTGYTYLALNAKTFLLTKNEFKRFLSCIIGLPTAFYLVWRIYFSIFSSNKSQISSTMLFALIGIVVLVVFVVAICAVFYKRNKYKINLKFTFYVILFLPMVIYAILLTFKSSIFNGNDNYYISILVRFADAYFSSSIFTHPFKITYYFINLFVTLSLLGIGYLRKLDNDYYSIPVMFYFGSLGYAMMIMLSYMFVFGYEGYTLVVFGRYMQTYTLAAITLLILIVLNESLSIKKMGIIAILSLLFVEPDSLSTLIYNKDWKNYRTEAQIQAIDDYFEYEYKGEKMAVFAQYDMRDLSLIGYLADEKKANITYYEGITLEQEDRFDEAIANNECAFVGTRDDTLIELWKKYSEDEPYNMSLYKINHDGDMIALELIYTWDDLN